jgi:hypothetical protein
MFGPQNLFGLEEKRNKLDPVEKGRKTSPPSIL